MPTNEEIDAAFAVAQDEARWSINKLATVRRMLEAAERVRENQYWASEARKLADGTPR
jgi:hypothetical protein